MMTTTTAPRLTAIIPAEMTSRDIPLLNYPTTACASPPILTTIMDHDCTDADLPQETQQHNDDIITTNEEPSPSVSQTSPTALSVAEENSSGEPAAVEETSPGVSKKKKSKRRRWVLSRRPKCFSSRSTTTGRGDVGVTTTTTKRRQKRRGIVQPDEENFCAETTVNGMSSLESAVHASIFLPHKCQENGIVTTMENGVACADDAFQSTASANSIFNDDRRHLHTMRLLLPHLRAITKSKSNYDVQAWTVDDVAKFVQVCWPPAGDKLSDRFKDELIDGEALLLLKFDDFYKQMNIKLGPSLKIYWSVDYLKHLRSSTKSAPTRH